ncbi:MAG: DUF418 domain-containing protein [Sphingomonadaceae bacterium]|nr:DUF418 domain-containing protein [Sphingomonadaceae bacterium]
MSEQSGAPLATRITGLDVTRGFAVMGILLMNIVAFAMPDGAYISPRNWGGHTGSDLWVWAANFVLFDSKMRGLFSLMFGASTLLVIESARASGAGEGRVHYGRMAVLALFGLIHFYLIWFGDILFLYAMVGMLLYAFRNCSMRALRRWFIGFFLLGWLIAGMMTIPLLAGGSAGAPAELQQVHRQVAAQFAHESPETAQQIAIYRADFGTMVATRFAKSWYSPLVNIAMYGAETLALMLMGMMLYKSGMLQGQWSLARLDKWRNYGLGIGIIANLGLLWWQLAGDVQPIPLLFSTFFASVPFDFLMSAGYAALFMGLAQRFATSAWTARVAAVGRAAFTNYLGTSILMAALFYGWGLGQFGHWSRTAVYLPVAGVWLIMLLWSKPWLERHYYGPLEWLWRSMARRSLQPMRKNRPASA